MFGIFMESFVILKLYTGLKLLLLLSVVAWVYLLVTEKNKSIRILLVYAPMIVVALFLFPVSRKGFVAIGLDGETYYRILWTIPLGIIFVYGMCRLFERHRRIGLVAGASLIAACGSYVYQGTYISRAENLYHIPDTVVNICDLIGPEDEESRVSAVMPGELIHFVRQYNTSINMPYGREMLVNAWDYYNAVYEAMEKPEVVDMEELLKATREEYCQYIILSKERRTKEDPEACGLLLLDEIDGYLIYEDPVTAQVVNEWQVYYEDEE
ncbi:hypothetical protein [Parablautia muri]|uniref:Uncharacterized protein n=1 Tax=Parablautia muri TaxID=2320879 RepID=A0A9X5GST5_9FIRM|nr:hypothetical protein [Parablautia muri]NBJ92262.1 hypothetical protein [Parablautia muri]